MKKYTMILTLLLLINSHAFAQGDVTIVAPTSEAAQGLDLIAVSEIFKATENLEEFEKTINDPELGINNLDLDDNGEVDFIRVVEEIVDDTHIIILQAAIDVDEFQDVAIIEVEKSGDQYNMQIQGHEVIYGANYYIAPTHVHVHTWPIITWIYRPVYRPYRSVYYYGNHPRWWRPFRPVHYTAYRTRTVKFKANNTFLVTKTRTVRPVTRVRYKTRNSPKVINNIQVKKTTQSGGKTTKKVGVKKTKTNAKGTTVTKKKGVKKTTDKSTGKTKVKKVKKKEKKKKN